MEVGFGPTVAKWGARSVAPLCVGIGTLSTHPPGHGPADQTERFGVLIDSESSILDNRLLGQYGLDPTQVKPIRENLGMSKEGLWQANCGLSRGGEGLGRGSGSVGFTADRSDRIQVTVNEED